MSLISLGHTASLCHKAMPSHSCLQAHGPGFVDLKPSKQGGSTHLHVFSHFGLLSGLIFYELIVKRWGDVNDLEITPFPLLTECVNQGCPIYGRWGGGATHEGQGWEPACRTTRKVYNSRALFCLQEEERCRVRWPRLDYQEQIYGLSAETKNTLTYKCKSHWLFTAGHSLLECRMASP